MDRSAHSIPSPVGVDVVLPVAGTGSRSYAFLIDWHIRLLLALAWFIAAALAIAGTLRYTQLDTGVRRSIGLFALLPAAGIYLLYHPVIELLTRGRTPGLRMAGLRIVTRDGGTPGIGSLLVRNLFRLIDSLPVGYMVGMVSTIFTRDHVTIGDLAAGTLLVHDRGQAIEAIGDLARYARSPAHDPAALDLAAQLLGRWRELAVERRARLARELLARLAPAQPPAGDEPDHALRARLESVLADGQRGAAA